MTNSFPVLTFVSKLLRFVGWLLIVVALLYFVLWAGVVQPARHERIDVIQIFIGLGVTSIGLVAVVIGECVGVLFAIEANTRQAATRLATLPVPARASVPVVATARAQANPVSQPPHASA